MNRKLYVYMKLNTLKDLAHGPKHMSLYPYYNSILDDFWGGRPIWDVLTRPHNLLVKDFDVQDEGSQYVVYVDVPGIPRENLRATYNESSITVSGERKSSRYHGVFTRTVSLPRDADIPNASAKMENGVVTFEVPKLVPPQLYNRNQKTINIQ